MLVLKVITFPHFFIALIKKKLLVNSMTKAKLYVFSSPTCPHCPTAKELAKQATSARDDVMYNDVMSGSHAAEKLFKKFDVASVPTIIITGPGYPSNIGLRGAQSIPVLNKYIDMALGVESEDVQEEKPAKSGFFARMKSFLKEIDA